VRETICKFKIFWPVEVLCIADKERVFRLVRVVNELGSLESCRVQREDASKIAHSAALLEGYYGTLE
jgi:hypothetical protein